MAKHGFVQTEAAIWTFFYKTIYTILKYVNKVDINVKIKILHSSIEREANNWTVIIRWQYVSKNVWD